MPKGCKVGSTHAIVVGRPEQCTRYSNAHWGKNRAPSFNQNTPAISWYGQGHRILLWVWSSMLLNVFEITAIKILMRVIILLEPWLPGQCDIRYKNEPLWFTVKAIRATLTLICSLVSFIGTGNMGWGYIMNTKTLVLELETSQTGFEAFLEALSRFQVEATISRVAGP